MSSNVGKSLIAKQRKICQMIDEGYEIKVPDKQKWDPKKVKGARNESFIKSLNTASISLLN